MQNNQSASTGHTTAATPYAVNRRAVGLIKGLTINVPHWFSDPEFMAWLNDPDTVVYSWHCKGDAPHDYSDTVVTIEPNCRGDGANSDMPPQFWNEIVETCREVLGVVGDHNPCDTHYFVRLTNLEE